MKRVPRFFLFGAAGLAMCSGASAAIVSFSQNFVGTGSITGWTSVGMTTTTIQHSTSVNDGTGGDGTAGDGSLFFNLVNNTSGDEAIGYDFTGTMTAGESYSLTSSTFNGAPSYNSYSIQLVNVTDNLVLAQSTGLGQNGGTIGTVERTLNYTALSSDEGDVLRFRIVETGDNGSRDIYLDRFQLSVVPEPSVALLGGIGAFALLLRRRA